MPNAPRELRDNKRWLLGFGLAVVLCANLLLIAILALGAWKEFSQPVLGVLPPGASPDLRSWFELYRDRVDSLSKLVTALIGLSALYSTVIGITAYLSAQSYVDRFKEALAETRKTLGRTRKTLRETRLSLQKTRTKGEAQLADFRARFPSFDEMSVSIRRIVALLAELVPDVERLADHEAALTPEKIAQVRYYEHSVAFFEFLKQDGQLDFREVYRRLGRFYRALYDLEKKRLGARGAALAIPRKKPETCSSEEVAAYELLDRSGFYIDHLLNQDPGNFAAFNEKAILTQEIDGSDSSPRAKACFERSIELNGKQQRALYWLGYIQMKGAATEQDLLLAEATFTRALSTDIWEREKSTSERNKDLVYNRACVRSRLGKCANDNGKDGTEWARKAVEDLMRASTDHSKPLLDNLLDDIKPDKDLSWLAGGSATEMKEIRTRMGDTSIP